MKIFYIDFANSNGIETAASSLEDVIQQVRAFNSGHTEKAEIQRISTVKTRGVKYVRWEG